MSKENALQLPGTVTTTHWEIPKTAKAEDLIDRLPTLNRIENSIKWYRGALLCFMEDHHEEKFSQMLDEREGSRSMFESEMWVFRKVPIENREEKLSWSHHRSVAALNPKDQKKYLAKAVQNGWTKRELDEALEDFKRKKKGQESKNNANELQTCCPAIKSMVENGSVVENDGHYYIQPADLGSEPVHMNYCFVCGAKLKRL